MDNDHYKELISESPVAYALHRIICDEQGGPVDFVYIELNKAYTKMTGLASQNSQQSGGSLRGEL